MKQLWTLLLMAALVMGAGCKRADESAASIDPISLNPAPAHAAWLARNLPEQTLAYARLPTLWDGLFSADSGALNNAIGGEGFQQQIAILRQGVIDNVLPDLPAEARPALELLLAKLRGPIEVAIMSPNPKALMANVLVMVQLNGGQATVDQLFSVIEMASQGSIALMAPMNDGKAMLSGTPVPAFVQFDETSGRLGIFSGMAPSASDLEQLMTGDMPTTRRLIDFESTIDDSGLLPSLWLDGSTLWALAEASTAMVPIPIDELKATGLDQLDFAWLGFGARQGKGTMRMHLQMPHVGVRQLLPTTAPGELPQVDVIGRPSLLFNVRIPSKDELRAAGEWLAQFSDEFNLAEVEELVANATRITEFDLTDIFDAYGSSIFLIDEAGFRSAGRLRDSAAKERFMRGATTFTNTESVSRRYAETNIQHWAVPNLQGLLLEHLPEDGELELDSIKVLDYLTRTKTHLFYLTQGDTEIYASVPQALADYEHAEHRQPLNEWLAARQLDWDQTILGFAGPSKNVARKFYYYYIEGLLMLGDLADVELDPFALPTASELGLAVDGRAGIMLDSTANNLTLRIDYEHNALEPLFISGTGAMSAVAVIGILAAVAIPAYQDYESRTQLAGTMVLMSTVRNWVLEQTIVNDGAWPSAESIADAFPGLAEAEIAVYVEEESNLLMFEIFDHESDEFIGAEFYFEYVDNGQWECSADYIEEKLLPADCR